jgi:aldehyde dehydrogenase (NAD+)
MADEALASLQATALTARCHNPFFRQKQLKCLHDVLRKNSSAIKDAIVQDSRTSDADATTEVALTLNVVKDHYAAIGPDEEFKTEYRIANGHDAADAREPWGVIYVEPLQSHTPFFSAVSALSAAVAAGNCVALKVSFFPFFHIHQAIKYSYQTQLENTLRALSSLLRTLLPQALEPDTFAIVSSAPSSNALAQCLQVLQETHVSEPGYTHLASPRRKVVAVVDRTADLAAAAEQLVTARFAFGGTSPYAPDVVLVNEFVRKEFLECVLKNAIRFMAVSGDIANGSTPSKHTSPSSNKTSPINSALNSLTENKSWNFNTITRGDTGAIIELTHPTALPPKLSQPLFCIASITSLEHAISLVEADTEPPLAGYHFSTPQAGKYLAQFIPASASFINHIPYTIILGPAAPDFHPLTVSARYSTSQFSRAAPAFITPPSSQPYLSKALISKDQRKAAAELLSTATQEIKEKKRKESIAIGYFEQGIFIGLGVYGIPLLTCVGATLFFGVRAGLRRWVFV